MAHDTRYEMKMVAQAAAYAGLRMHLRTDRGMFRTLFPPRRVQSLYFDTLDDRSLEENLAGVSHREKLRFRWYGDGRARARGVLERKVRENMLGWKELLPIDAELAVEGVSRRAFTAELRRHLTPAFRDLVERDELPVQWIRYDREYYASEAGTGSVRITIDRGLTTWDQRYRRELSASFRSPVPDVVIVEAKCAEADYAALKAILGRFPLRVDKCSKFVFASDRDDGAPVSIVTS